MSNFAAGNQIDLAGIAFSADISMSYATSAITCTLNQGTNGGSFWSPGVIDGLGTDSYKNIEGG